MLTGNKKDIYKLLPFVSPRLAQALAYIAATDFSKIPNGEYEIDGRHVFARVNTYDTEPKAQRRAQLIQMVNSARNQFFVARKTWCAQWIRSPRC